MTAEHDGDERAPSAARREPVRALLALVALATIAAHAGTLALSFQLDDHTLLADPWALFALGYHDTAGEHAYALRFTVWALWGVLDALPGPPSEVAHRLVGLALHAATAVWLARALLRARAGTTAAAFAGLVFGVGGGAAQAFTWSSAWGDLVATAFAALAAERFLAARFGGPGRAARRRVAAAAALLAALLAKESLLPLAPALWLALAAAPDPRGGARSRVREAAWIGGALAVALVARWLYLGTFEPSYAVERSWLRDVARAPAAALLQLGQALAPYNAEPLVSDVVHGGVLGAGPFASLLARGSAPVVGLALLAATLAAGLFARPPRAAAIAALTVAAVLVALPAGLIASGEPHNGFARTMAAPMLFTAGALGIAVGGLRAPARVFAAALWVALVVPLSLGVGAVERAASRERVQQVRSVLAPAQHGAPERVVLVEPPGDFAGVPQLGDLWPRAVRPPFAPDFALAPELVEDAHGVLARLAEPAGETWVVLAEGAAAAATGAAPAELAPAALRGARRALLFELPASRAPEELVLDGPAPHAWFEPVPLHGLAGLTFELAPEHAAAGPLTVTWHAPQGQMLSVVVPAVPPPAGAPRIFTVLVPHDFALRVGPPLAAVSMVASGAPTVAVRVRAAGGAPTLGLVPPDVLDLSAGAAAPRVTLRVPDDASGASAVRIVIEFDAGDDTLRFASRTALAGGVAGGGEIELALDELALLDPARPAQLGPSFSFEAFARDVAAPTLARLGRVEGELRWSAELGWSDTVPAARSAAVTARYRAIPARE